MNNLKVIYQNLIAEYLILIRRPAGLFFAIFLPTLVLVVIGVSFPGEFLDITHSAIVIMENDSNKILVDSIREKISSDDFDLTVMKGDQSFLETLVTSKEYLLGIYPRLKPDSMVPEITVVVDNSNPSARDPVLVKLMSQIQEDSDSSGLIRKKEVYEGDLGFIDYLFPGIIGLGIMFFCLSLASIGVVRDRVSGSLERIRSSPLPLWTFLISKYIAYIILAAVSGVLILIAGEFIFNIPIAGSIWLVLLLEILTATPFIGLALITSTIGKSEFEAQVIVFFIALPLIFISGIFFPIQSMPVYMQKVVKYFPLAFSVEALRDVTIRGMSFPEVSSAVIALISYSLAFFIPEKSGNNYSILLTYSPVSVLISIMSPALIKTGTFILASVSRITVLGPDWAFSPLTLGGACFTFKLILMGRDTLINSCLNIKDSTI
jgi:ABC-2 type transport system permease protein